MLADIEAYGYDYTNQPLQANGCDVLQIQIEGDQVAIGFTATRAAPDREGLEALLRQLCTDCGLEFIALAPA